MSGLLALRRGRSLRLSHARMPEPMFVVRGAAQRGRYPAPCRHRRVPRRTQAGRIARQQRAGLRMGPRADRKDRPPGRTGGLQSGARRAAYRQQPGTRRAARTGQVAAFPADGLRQLRRAGGCA